MKIIDGKKIADNILADLKEQIKLRSYKPILATILVGDNAASRLYISLKERAAKKIGIGFKKYILDASAGEKEILEIIESLNKDDAIQGILVQFPLPNHLVTSKIIKNINLEKDVDGFLPESVFNPPFILAIWEVLESTGENLENKKIVALVNSIIFGNKLKYFFKKNGLEINIYKDLTSINNEIREADILITACGCPGFIKSDMIKNGVIILDGGISKQNGKVVGDVDIESVKEKANWLSPVPGGIGPITIAMLLKNIVEYT